MKSAASAALVDFADEIDRALRHVKGGDTDEVTATAQRLSDRLPDLENWAEEVRATGRVEAHTAQALTQLQGRAFRLAKVVRHIQWVRQGLSDIESGTVSGYERNGHYRPPEGARIAVEG
jgi:hypothetical protein